MISLSRAYYMQGYGDVSMPCRTFIKRKLKPLYFDMMSTRPVLDNSVLMAWACLRDLIEENIHTKENSI